MTSHVTGRPGGLRGPDVGERRRRRDVGEVEPRAGDVARRRRRGSRSPARPTPTSRATGQPLRPEHRRDVALGRLGALGERRVLRVVDDRAGRARPRTRARCRGATPRRTGAPSSREARRRRRRRARRARRGSRPCGPAVTAPWTSTRTGDPDAVGRGARPARPRAGSSMAGVVLGIRQTVVNPPCAAAARPVATVSASSLPGSRKCAWRSTNPGAISTPSGAEAVGVRRPRASVTPLEPPVARPRPRPRPRGPPPGPRPSRGT